MRRAWRLLLPILLAACGPVPQAPGPAADPSGLPTAAPSIPPTAGPAASPGPAAGPSALPTAAASSPPTTGPAASPGPLASPTPRPGPTAFQVFDLAPGAAGTYALTPGAALTVVAVRLGPGEAAGRLSASTPPASGRRLAQARTLGEEERFWVNTGDFAAAGDRERRCRRVGTRGRVTLYVDVEAAATAERLDSTLVTFEREVLPAVEAAFGALEGPFAGGGPVVLVVSPAVDDFGARRGALGYFWARDLMPDEPRSNRLAALFFSDDLLRRPAVVRRAVLGHEAAHLVDFARGSARAGRPLAKEPWLAEGLGMLAQDLVGAGWREGYPHTAEDVAAFQADPEAIGLLDWAAPVAPRFGRSYLLARYMYDRFGAAALRAVVDSGEAGAPALEAAIAPHGLTFADFVRDWALALYFPRASADWRWRGPALAGEAAGVRLPGFSARTWPGDGSIAPRPWGMHARSRAGGGPWRVELLAPASDRLVGAISSE